MTLPQCILHELLVTLGPGEDNVDPDPHRLRGRRHQVEHPFQSLDTERGASGNRSRRADRLEMVDEDVGDRLEEDGAAGGPRRLQLIGVVDQTAPRSVEHEPATIPLAQSATGGHLPEEAAATGRSDVDVAARLGQVVTARLDELAKVDDC